MERMRAYAGNPIFDTVMEWNEHSGQNHCIWCGGIVGLGQDFRKQGV